MARKGTQVPMADKLSIHDRLLAVMSGRTPDRVPFVDRLELWYLSVTRRGVMPPEFEGMSLTEIHAAIGFGQLKFVFPCAFRLRGVELVMSIDGEVVLGETDPVVERFPALLDRVDGERIGMQTFELRTPVGTVTVRQELLEEAYLEGQIPYCRECPIKGPDDYRTVEWILDRIEIVPLFDRFREAERTIGDLGFVAPMVPRIPFQESMIAFLGEVPFFYALADEPKSVLSLMSRVHEVNLELLNQLAAFEYPYVEFSDNLSGLMTNPRLFAEYCIPHLQQYSEILHGQGKKMGDHTDGDLKALLPLIRESGLDVCESFSPAPLTACTFDEAWEAWRDGGPIMWGVIPSPLLEAPTPEPVFHGFVDHVLETVGRDPVILGVSDMVLGNNLIDRVRYVADRVEENVL